MARISKLPLQREVTIYVARDTLLMHTVSKTTAGVVNPLAGYTTRGSVKASKDHDGVQICAVQFDNDLANGVIKAFVDEDDAADILTAVGDGGTAYIDIVRTDAAGWDQQYYEIVGTVSEVVTPEVSA